MVFPTGLSKEKVGEYLGNLQSPFSMKVLYHFMQEFNFAGQRIDKSLRALMEFVCVSGEAQRIEKIMEVFGKRYNKCNPSFASKLKSPDSVVTLSFATMLLNTDLHTPNLRYAMNTQNQSNKRWVPLHRAYSCLLYASCSYCLLLSVGSLSYA